MINYDLRFLINGTSTWYDECSIVAGAQWIDARADVSGIQTGRLSLQK